VPKDTSPWTLTVPDEVVAPRGRAESGQSAIQRLGPFEHCQHEEAQRHRRKKGGIAPSEELALQQVLTLARSFNHHEYLNKNAPRTKEVVENLQNIQRLSFLLAKQMQVLDDVSRHRLHTAGTGLNYLDDLLGGPLMVSADVAALPRPAEGSLYPVKDNWVDRLNALSVYAQHCLEVFLTSKGLENAEGADKGGNTNLYKQSQGAARWRFVHDGWYIYELFKPGEATGTEGGPFHLFLMDVFEYATGLEPEENSKLTSWLKQVAKHCRAYGQITERQRELDAERRRLDREGPKLGLEEWQKRSQPLNDEYLKLERKRMDLWPLLYPNMDKH